MELFIGVDIGKNQLDILVLFDFVLQATSHQLLVSSL